MDRGAIGHGVRTAAYKRKVDTFIEKRLTDLEKLL